MKPQSGIAIGPILFIIAILAILAAAIAAGTGGFSGGTASESAKMQAASLIQIGENLKLGVDNLVINNSVSVANITTGSTLSTDLFSTSGGGILPPSTTPLCPTCSWLYLYGNIPGFGTAAVEFVAMGNVSQSTCDTVNLSANGLTSSPIADIGGLGFSDTFSGTLGGPALSNNYIETPGSWPASLQGKMVGCIYNSNGNFLNYYFYQVLAVQ